MLRGTRVYHEKFGIGYIWKIKGKVAEVKFVLDIPSIAEQNSVREALENTSTTRCSTESLIVTELQGGFEL